MKKKLKHIVVLIMCSFGIILNAQQIQWEKSFGGNHSDFLYDAIPTADYGFLLAGSSTSGKSGNKTQDNRGNHDYSIWKMDEFGDLVWQKSYGGEGIDLLYSIKNTIDGGFILGGSSNSNKCVDKSENSFGGSDYWVIKLDPTGGVQWDKTFGGLGQDDLINVVICPKGGYFLVGHSDSTVSGNKTAENYGSTDYWILKLDQGGKVEWEKTFGGKYSELARHSIALKDGGILIGGVSNSPESSTKTKKNHGGNDYWVLRLDKFGNVVWENVYGGNDDDELTSVIETQNGDFILGGYSKSESNYNKTASNKRGDDFWVLRINDEGFIKWQNTYHIGENDVLMTVLENPDESIILGGYAKAESSVKDADGINDYALIKINALGEFKWDYYVGSEGEDILRKVLIARDGQYVLVGSSNSTFERISKKEGSKKSTNSFNRIRGVSQNSRNIDKIQGRIDENKTGLLNEVNGIYESGQQELNEISNSAGLNKYIKQNGNQKLLQNGSNSKSMNLDAMDVLGGVNKKLPPSGKKSFGYGNIDFWVVKIKDKENKNRDKVNIEAIPNPAKSFTNVIVNFEYQNGTASIYDIAGRMLWTKDINGEKTIPVSMSNYPEGIYLVEIRTNTQTESVKVMNVKN